MLVPNFDSRGAVGQSCKRHGNVPSPAQHGTRAKSTHDTSPVCLVWSGPHPVCGPIKRSFSQLSYVLLSSINWHVTYTSMSDTPTILSASRRGCICICIPVPNRELIVAVPLLLRDVSHPCDRIIFIAGIVSLQL